MNSIKEFMDVFDRKRIEKAWTELTLILKESYQYFQNIPKSERGRILRILFDERRGLLFFLNYAIDQRDRDKSLESTIIEAFQLLTFLITEFTDVYEPYIETTQAVCKLAVTIKAGYYLKSAATKTFVELIRAFRTSDLDFGPTIAEFLKKFRLYGPGEKRLILQIISEIARHFPQTAVFARRAKAIRHLLNTEIIQTYDAVDTKNLYGLPVHIESLKNLLYNFPPTDEDVGAFDGAKALYTNLKKLCTPKERDTSKQLVSAIMDLLAEHLSLFDVYVYADYEFWYVLLRSFVNKGWHGDAAINTLKMYYKTMGTVIGRNNSENDRTVFLYLRDCFVKNLSDGRLSSAELRLTVYGFSQIIEPCKNYFAEAGVEDMFSLIAHRTIPLYAREDDEAARFEEIADYQEALSRIIRYLSNVSIDQIRALTTLCSILIKRFPELSIADQQYATSSLNRTIVNVRYTKEILYQDFISHIIYDGIVWSCSHMLLIDAELKRDEDDSPTKGLITYKDYVPLWQGLLNPANYASTNQNSDVCVAALQRVVDEIISTCIALMKTLNLNVKSKENNVFSDVKVSQTVENESDFRIFLNLVDLYVEILANVENFLWSNTLKKFLYEIIKNSYKNPLISGFYKLANAVLMASGAFQSEDSHSSNGECFNLVLQYLWNTLDAITQYPQELQISCLQLILKAPESFVRRIVDRAVPAFKISFTLGLTNYEVATMALDALERWTKCLGSDCPRDFVGELVPCLELYLQSEESSIHLLQDIEETKRNVKRVTLLDDEKTVEAFQKRILLFFGSMDNDVMLEFIHRRSLNTGATWSKKDLLKYPMPFPDIELNINLDAMLPRIIELALSSGDRRTRVAASEVLHTVVAFMLGRTGNLWGCDPHRFTSLYETLCPALLRLGCDTDDVIMQLYHPLMMQITHWLSSGHMLNSGATIHLVDSLFVGLTDETNSSLRDVSGIYLAEFVRWSIKQSTDNSLARCPTNIDLIVQRIINFALDPSSRKRVAAAIAFNHLYKILRENEEIVNIFWFDILHAFVKSLDGCKDTRINDAIRHVERVLIEKAQIFNEDSVRRRKPPEFSGAHVRLEDAAKWILTQCRSLDRNCRKTCFDLFASVSRRVDGRGTAKSVLSAYLRTEGMQRLNEIVVGDLDDKSRPVSAKSLEILLRTLDLYVWLIREKLVDNEILFTDFNPSRNVVFNCIINFVNSALLMADTVENHASLRLQEFVRLKTLRCEIIITLFDFIPVLLEVKNINDDYVPDYVFGEALFSLVSVCLMRPRRVGFDSSNLQLTEELPAKLEALLNEAARSLPEALMNSMRNVLSGDIKKFSAKLFQLDEILSNEVVVSEKSVRGLILLQKCRILKTCPGCSEITANASTKIIKIFDILETENLGSAVCFYPETEVKNYLQRLVELLLTDYDVDTMKTVVQLLMNNAELHRSDLTIITHGEYFLSVFKDVVLQCCLRDVEKTLNLLVDSIQDNPDNVLRITEALVLYLQRNRADYQDTIDRSVDLVLEKFAVLQRAVNNLEHRRNVFLNIYAIAVRLKRTPLDVLVRRNEIYRWILGELVACNKFKHKIRLLRDFLICLTNETSDDNQELMAILYNLKNERRIVTSPDDPTGTRGASPETIDCFQTLLKLLLITKSSVVFAAVMNFAMGAGKLLCEDKVTEYLKLYFASISAPSVLRSLELAYQRFMNTSNTEDRCDVLLYFLLPSFSNCSPQTMENFFERNTKEIYTTIMQTPTDNLDDRQQLFVSKIGCYNLVEIMFANLPRDRIDCSDSPITLSTIGATGADDKFSKRIFRSTLPIRQLRAIDGDNREIVRLVHCAAYNCCIAIVSMTKDERFYLAVFGENRAKNQLIWENIVDTTRQYELRQTSKEYPKERKKLVNIRKSVKDKKNSEDHYSYIKSYDLATSTLSENICAYDLNAVNVMSRPGTASHRPSETMSLTLEVDDLNDHECMAPICALLIHMLNNEISRPQSGPTAKTLPKWMAEFRRSMSSEHVNVRLFMLKIVLNTQAVFKPYAEFFLEPIITTIYKSLKDAPLNYLMTDALVMLVDWQDVAVPNSEKTEKLGQLLLIILVERATVAPTKYIIRYNMSILEMIVDAWHDSLTIPSSFAHWMSQKDSVAVRLVLIFLTNKMAEKIATREDVWEYLLKLMVDWKGKEEPVLQTFEAVGLMLRHSESAEDFDERKNRVTEIARSVFRGMQSGNPGRLVKCVDAMCKAYPALTEEFYQFVSASRLRVECTNIVKCLQVFSLAIPKMNEEDIIKELNYMQFSALLENKVLSCEKKCLEIMKQLVPLLGPLRLHPLIELVSRYSEHEALEYRSICYDVFTALYKKYSADTSGMVEVTEMMESSRRILLSGLLDPAESIQQSAMEFWSEMTDLRNKCSERLLDILDIYTSGVEKNFLQIMTLMLLQLTKKSTTYEKKMFDPLHSCSYHDHAISVSWKSRNFESRIPLFAPSIASRMNQRLTQYSYAMGSPTSSCAPRDSQENFMLRATDAPNFEETFLGEVSISAGRTADASEEGIFAIPKVPELSKNKVSRRFLADGPEPNSTSRKKHAASRFAEQEYRREYLARKRSSVKLYRKYRIGDFPDIEISHATVLGPMQALVKKDPVICKNLIVSLIRSLIDQIGETSESDRYCAELSERLTRILKKRRRTGVVMSAIFEIMFNVDELEFPWEVVTDVARADGLFAQGALLTERSLIYGIEDRGPPAKRQRVEDSTSRNGNVDRWIELAGLYESMNEFDVVLSIFKGEMFSEELHVASAARAAAEWERAEESYARAYESESGVKIKRHCLQGTFECFSRLTKWKTLENVIETRVQPNFDTLLEPDDAESAWIAPWIFRVHTHRFLDRKGNDAFINALESYLRNADKCRVLRELFGEETAVIVSDNRPDVSRDFLNGSCDKIRENWIQLSPLAVPLRSRAVVKLRGIHDIDSYLKTVESPDIAEASRALLNYWKNSVPSIRDDLLAWDSHLSYRSYFSTNLIDKLDTESQEGINISNALRSVRAGQMLTLVECALNQRNRQVAKKYLLRAELDLNYCNQELIDKFDLNAIRYKFLNAEMIDEPDKSSKDYVSSWKKAHELLNGTAESSSSQVAVREIISTMASLLGRIASERPEFFAGLASRSTIIQDISSERIDIENATESLKFYSFTNLKHCCLIAEDIGECHVRLAKYCYENMFSNSGDSELSREFVRATLRAMSCGSEEATHYFPCLLKEEFLSDKENQKIFRDESSKVETWRFLVWQTQLLSSLGTSIGIFVLPIVERMIATYPNALVYSLRLTLDTKPHLRNDPSILPLIELLADKHEFNKFLDAMQYVVQPELYLEYHLKELLRNLSHGRATIVDALMSKVYPTPIGDQIPAMQGQLYRKTIASYKQEIGDMVDMPVEDIGPRVSALLNRLRHSLNIRDDRNRLKDYSPWLHKFVGRDIEVPGQYTGKKRPSPRYHAKIVKIESVVKVMQSVRRPIRITIVANDAKNYRFLVKFGEDLRLDQRVEQIFGVMNETLKSDVACSQRRLSVDTYQVFPLSGSLGFIQWIDGTKTLLDYINFSLDDNKRRQHHRVRKEYEEWIAKTAPGKSPTAQYKEALKYPAEEVQDKMNELTNKIGWDLLRRTFVLLSPSMESFMSLRQNFTTSYAAMSIAQWILGIGDRHLGNTLISVESGRSLGIDFGSAFGGGVDQAVPELMPFRLTAQIRGLLKPFTENDLMGATMIHVLRALRNGKGPLLACLNVVAHEQLNWEEHVNKLSQDTLGEAVDVKWLPAKKVRIVSKKLAGAKPSSVTLEQLADGHSDKEYYYRYAAIVSGTDSDEKSKRAFIREDNLSPEEQVQCLIEQATDANVLGRTYVGWTPWL